MTTTLIYCTVCGRQFSEYLPMCPECGYKNSYGKSNIVKNKNWKTAIILAIFLGFLGGHRFYVGKTGSAIAMIALAIMIFPITFIWWVFDIIKLVNFEFTTKNGNILKP